MASAVLFASRLRPPGVKLSEQDHQLENVALARMKEEELLETENSGLRLQIAEAEAKIAALEARACAVRQRLNPTTDLHPPHTSDTCILPSEP
jgi:hypothetical protein